MNDADLRILEMYHEGWSAELIAEELRMPFTIVQDVIRAFEDGEYKTR